MTPEFPAGTWAYFTTINDDATPAFPYTTGRQYFGSPTGGNSTVSETFTIFWNGGPNLNETPASIEASGSDDVTITWNVVEGGIYKVEASDSHGGWGEIATRTATGDTLDLTESAVKSSHPARFYRISRTSLATFDSNGFDYPAGGGGNVSYTFNFSTAAPPLPPEQNPVTIRVSGVPATITAYNGTTGSATVSFSTATLTSGSQHTALLSFTPPGQGTIYKTSTNTYLVP